MALEFLKELLRRLQRRRRLWLRILVCCWNRARGIGWRGREEELICVWDFYRWRGHGY